MRNHETLRESKQPPSAESASGASVKSSHFVFCFFLRHCRRETAYYCRNHFFEFAEGESPSPPLRNSLLFQSSSHPRSPVVTWWPRDGGLRNNRLCLGLVFAVLTLENKGLWKNWTKHLDKTAYVLRGFLGPLLFGDNIVCDNAAVIHKDNAIVKNKRT